MFGLNILHSRDSRKLAILSQLGQELVAVLVTYPIDVKEFGEVKSSKIVNGGTHVDDARGVLSLLKSTH